MDRKFIEASKIDRIYIKTDIITSMMIQWASLLFLTIILCLVSIWFLIPMTCLIVISSFSDITEKILSAWQPNRHYLIVTKESITCKKWKKIKKYNLDQIDIAYLSMRETLDSPPRLVITTKDKKEILECIHIRKKDAQKIQDYLKKTIINNTK